MEPAGAPPPLWWTASGWLSLLGASAIRLGYRRFGSTCLLAVGFGYAGLVWGRLCDADVRRLRDANFDALDPVGLLWHGLAGYAGWKALRQ